VKVSVNDTVPPAVQFVHDLPVKVNTSHLGFDLTAADSGSGVRSLSVNGIQVYPYVNGVYHCDLSLSKGDNSVIIVATDNVGNQWSQIYHVTYAPSAPPASLHMIVLVVGSKTMTIDGARTTLDAPPSFWRIARWFPSVPS